MEFAADPSVEKAFAVDGPREHGTLASVLDQASEGSGIAGAQFSGSSGFVEELFCFSANRPELSQRDGVEVGVGQVNLQVGEAVGYGFGGGGEAGAVGVKFDEGLERRGMLRTAGGELLRYARGSGTTDGEQQTALGAEALDQCSRDDAGFLGNGGEGELYVCTATNTWTAIYRPYTYPHPLTQ